MGTAVRHPVIVVGAGIAGLACAAELVSAGLPVRLRERSRVPGGRLSTRRFDGRPADLGAAYFTVDHPAFAEVVRRWRAAGLTREWTQTFLAYDASGSRPVTGPTRWAAPRGLRSLAEEFVAALGSGGSSDGGFVIETGRPVAWVEPAPTARRGTGPGRTHHRRPRPGASRRAGGGRTRGRACRPRTARPAIVRHRSVRPPVELRPTGPGRHRLAAYHLDDQAVGLAGDAFGRPKVQTAWLSGRALGRDLSDRLAA